VCLRESFARATSWLHISSGSVEVICPLQPGREDDVLLLQIISSSVEARLPAWVSGPRTSTDCLFICRRGLRLLLLQILSSSVEAGGGRYSLLQITSSSVEGGLVLPGLTRTVFFYRSSPLVELLRADPRLGLLCPER